MFHGLFYRTAPEDTYVQSDQKIIKLINTICRGNNGFLQMCEFLPRRAAGSVTPDFVVANAPN